MPRKKKNPEQKELVIYLLLSPSEKKFFLGNCLKASLDETYRHILKGRRKLSAAFIEELQPKRPCLFVLEDFTGTDYDAKALIVIWTKIFLENGYKSYNQTGIIEMSQNLYYDSEKLYEEKKKAPLNKILSCANCQIPTWKNQTCSKYLQVKDEDKPQKIVQTKRRKRGINGHEIRMIVPDEEYEIILRNAEKCNMQVNPYIRKVALNPTIIKKDYAVIAASTKEIAEVRNAMNRLIFTIEAQNNYQPREIESMVSMMTEIFQIQKKLLRTIREQRN